MVLPKIILIGAGNVGYHLGARIRDCGLPLLQVYSRTAAKARALAQRSQTHYTTQLSRISPEGDLYILAVNDDSIGAVAEQLARRLPKGKLLVHTSGATPSGAIAQHYPGAGILYPLQTFSLDRQPDFEQIPICIHAQQPVHLRLLETVGRRISPKVYPIDDEQRAILHVAAVFVNNFTNHLFSIGEDICLREELPFELLKPLIAETVAKIQEHRAAEMQTGPAARGDQATIARHLDYLSNEPALARLYQQLSQSINPKLKSS
ncbi:MAG: DUF2520 domain-containing protein [Bacteroidota bacterium]